MLGKGLPNAGIIYNDVTLLGVKREGNGNMRLWGIHGGRDYLDILYEDVLYSQIDETNAGLRVSLVEELTLDEFSELRHNMGRNRMFREVPENFSEFLQSVSLGEYRIYAHYTLKGRLSDRPKHGPEKRKEERVVIARRVRIEGPEERLARHEKENRQYRFYAFVSHAEGEKDEKWARWVQRRLEKFRIPVDAVSKLRREEGAASLPVTAGPVLPGPVPEKISVARGEIHERQSTREGGPVSPSESARYLIVICSPRTARSDRVERDVRDFVRNGKEDSIIPFIIGGEVVESGEHRCYPLALSLDVLGVTLRDGSPEEALVRIMARLLRVKYSRLYQRHLRERRRFMVHALAAASILLFLMSGLTGWAVSREMEAAVRREEADGLARFLAEDMRNESRLPEKVRAVIDEKLQEYREKHNEHSSPWGWNS
jgi:hypothetical protein